MKKLFLSVVIFILFIIFSAFLLTDSSSGLGPDKSFRNPHDQGIKIERNCLMCHVNNGGNGNEDDRPLISLLDDSKEHAETLICENCHDYHMGSDNLAFIWEMLETPNSGIFPVLFLNLEGLNSFADGDAVYDGVCEVCHTQTNHHRNNDSGDHNHYAGWDCTACHAHLDHFLPRSPHGEFHCLVCHKNHGPSSNLYRIREVIETPNSGPRNVIFLAQEGQNSFADGDTIYDGVCEVCHTFTTYHRNDDSGDHGHYAATNCADACHLHSNDFHPSN